MFGFVGRVTRQKGVHLILDITDDLIRNHNGQIHILVAGPAEMKEAYSAECAYRMTRLRHIYPNNFWADPSLFFTDGTLVNVGCDFCLMPSEFEPGGIVQHEFFIGGTPVIAYKTGGLRDTVIEYNT
jgi:starch synthase